MPKIWWKKSFQYLKPLLLIFPLISIVIQAPIQVYGPSLFLPGDSYYSSAIWVRRYLPNETITVDKMSYYVLVPYGKVKHYPADTRLFDQVISAIYESDSPRDIPKEWQILVYNKYISTWYPDVSASSSMLDRFYSRIYDSVSLTIFKGKI